MLHMLEGVLLTLLTLFYPHMIFSLTSSWKEKNLQKFDSSALAILFAVFYFIFYLDYIHIGIVITYSYLLSVFVVFFVHSYLVAVGLDNGQIQLHSWLPSNSSPWKQLACLSNKYPLTKKQKYKQTQRKSL